MTTHEYSAAEPPNDTLLPESSFTDEIDADDWDVAPPPKRRLHWTTVFLSFAAIAVLAFAGGIVAQKHWGKTSSGGFPGGGGLPAGFAANLGGAGGGAGGFGAAATTGTVSYIQGTTLYVTTTSGSVVKVRVPKGVPVGRTVEAKASGIRPGESVVIQGSKAGNGTVQATSVTVSPK
jgi:hypothetical protein